MYTYGTVDMRDAKNNQHTKRSKKAMAMESSMRNYIYGIMSDRIMMLNYPQKRGHIVMEELLLYSNYLCIFNLKPVTFKTRLTYDFITLTLRRKEADMFLPKLIKGRKARGLVHERTGQSSTLFIPRNDKDPNEVVVYVPAAEEHLVSIKVHDVDAYAFIRMTEASKHLFYYVSEVELALDLKPKVKKKLMDLHNFFRHYQYLLHAGKHLDMTYPTTTYYQDNRPAKTKQARNYIKEEYIVSQDTFRDETLTCALVPKKEFVRVEINLKRNALKKRSIANLLDVPRIDGYVFVKYMKMKTFNFRKFRNRYLKINGITEKNRRMADFYCRNIADTIKTYGINQANRVAKSIVPGNWLDDHPYGPEFNQRVSKLKVFSKKDMSMIHKKYPFSVII